MPRFRQDCIKETKHRSLGLVLQQQAHLLHARTTTSLLRLLITCSCLLSEAKQYRFDQKLYSMQGASHQATGWSGRPSQAHKSLASSFSGLHKEGRKEGRHSFLRWQHKQERTAFLLHGFWFCKDCFPLAKL